MSDSEKVVAIGRMTMPPGAWFQQDADGWQVGVSTRSPMFACFYFVFGAVLALCSVGGCIWLQVSEREFIWAVTAFGTCFLLFAVLGWVRAAMYLGGRVVLTVKGNDARLFTGLGSWGVTRRFNWSDIQRIDAGPEISAYGNANFPFILLAGNSQVALSNIINEAQRTFLLGVLSRMLAT
jgi:hypothetical protein